MKRPTTGTVWLTARPIAHRGWHDGSARIENTLPAFEAAARRNFAIECDVRLTGDGTVIVFHDAMLDRLTDRSGSVERMSWSDIRFARFSRSDVFIPTLRDLLDLVRGRVPLIVELKSDANASSQPLVAAVAAVVAAYGGPIALMSFHSPTMVAVRGAAPNLPRGMIVDAFAAEDFPQLSAWQRFGARHLLATRTVRPSFVACDVRRLPATVPNLLRRLGLPLLAWTVRTPMDRQRAAAWADQIIFEGFDPDA